MNYTALYRRLRPKTFSEVIGQKHIIKTIINEFETNRINHAYLFCGTRGTGKTSTAKIFAKLLNCENPKNNEPCGKCELCVAFEKNRSMNTFEIDAASNNSVDDIRELREEIKYPPTKGKYKIYIIDEVHMLSIGAFNALLKTLEEPPSYVIFILATTDPQKIPITILSRCQRFDFKRITSSEMVLAIKENIKTENIDIEDDALKYIASISDGAMRDALSILEQCNSFYYNEKITLEKVLEILGSVNDDIFFKLTDALIDFNSLDCINLIDEIILNGRDVSQFIADLITHFRNLLVAGISKENILEISNEKYEQLKNQFLRKDSDYFIKLINTFSQIQSQIRYYFNSRIILETTCIKLCSAISENDLTDIREKLLLLEKQLEEKQVEKIYINQEIKQEKEPVKLRELAIGEDFKKVIKNWQSVVKKFTEGLLFTYLSNSKPENLEDNFLYIVSEKEIEYKQIEKNKELIENVLEEMFEKKYETVPILKNKFMEKYKNVATKEKPIYKTDILQTANDLFPEGSFKTE